MDEDTVQVFCSAAGRVIAELADGNKPDDDAVQRLRQWSVAVLNVLPMMSPPPLPQAAPTPPPPQQPPPLPPQQPPPLPPSPPC
jgi:hypothetical protein